MGARLDKDSERPSLSPEGLLRALGVHVPASGIDWEALVRLSVLGDDVSQSQPFAGLNEAGAGAFTQAAVLGEFSTLEFVAGRRGCWVIPPVRGAGSRFLKYASPEVAPALLLPVVVPMEYILGTVETVVSIGTVLATGGPSFGSAANFALAALIGSGRFGIWLEPGSVLRFIASAANVASTDQVMFREPLAGP